MRLSMGLMVVAAFAGLATSAHAGHSTIVTVTATSLLGTSTTTYVGNDNALVFGTVDTSLFTNNDFGAQAQGWAWNRTTPQVLTSGANQIASVGRTATSFIDDPVVLLSFNVTAGAADTLFTITSIFVNTDPLTAYQMTAASAAMTASDGGFGDGVTLSHGGFNTGLFAFENNSSAAGFLLAPLSASGFQSVSANSTVLPGTIVSGIGTISSRFSFTLSANDTASGTSVYRIDVVPAPAAAPMLGIGGVLAARRRRCR